MTGFAVEGTVRVLAEAALQSYPTASAVAVKASGWEGRDTIALSSGENVPVRWCASVLEFREHLAGASPAAPMVLLTAVSEKEIGLDALAYVTGQRLRPMGIWDPLKATFDAIEIAGPVRRSEPLGQVLLKVAPVGGFDPAPNGILTEGHAWDQLIATVVGPHLPDPAALLEALTDPKVTFRFNGEARNTVEPILPGLAEALVRRFGVGADAMLAAVASGNADSAIALGLVCETLFGGEPDQARVKASVRVEKFFGSFALTAETALGLARGSRQLLERRSESEIAPHLERAGQILATVEGDLFSWRSDILPLGFEQRFEQLAGLLGDPESSGDALRSAVRMIAEHREGGANPRRAAASQMAARLRGWLDSEEVSTGSFPSAARAYVEEGGFVDWARDTLDLKEPNVAVAAAYGELLFKVDARRGSESRRFAASLAAATSADSLGDCIGVEELVRSVILPVAREAPTLFVLLDGLSEAVFRSLRSDLESRSWLEQTPGGGSRTPVVAMLPSLTKVSRASLFAGQRTTGSQADEREGFRVALEDLGQVSVHHKAEVGDRDGIEASIGDTAQRVVAVVVNAIDDRLDKGEQLQPDWTLESIGPLPWLLSAATAAGRVLVLAGDHGHVLERGSTLQAAEGAGARWRPASTPAGEEEVLLEGPRVLSDSGNVFVAATTEKLRYRKVATGYHGGASPQEVIAPAAVFCPPGVAVAGYEPASGAEPHWWLLEPRPEPTAAASTLAEEAAGQAPLFGGVEPDAPPPWVAKLLASGLYLESVDRVSRPPAEEKVKALLIELGRNSDVISDPAAALALQVAELRVGPLISSIQGVLNVDGYQVLTRDRVAGEIRLDRDQLHAQFDL